MIKVTKTFLPPLQEYMGYLERIWDSHWITNNGPLLRELETKLKEYFGVKHLYIVSNGTIAIQIALKVSGIEGDVITTPYSYVATTTSLLWENCRPVFVDIDPRNCCLDPKLIEEAITENTRAILPTHVYGIPCDIEQIRGIADKYQLPLIYDAAHAFGTVYQGRQLASYGDIATLSFHATKLFHMVEGGAILTNDDSIAQQIDYYRSFGHKGDDYFTMGINAKNSEFHAAMGLCMLPRVQAFIERRKVLSDLYDQLLEDTTLLRPQIPTDISYNYAYYPVIFPDKKSMLQVYQALKKEEIFPRRYFFPSLNQLPYLDEHQSCPVSERYTSQVLSLPLYVELQEAEVERICHLIKTNMP